MAQIRRTGSIGIGRESTAGTAITEDHWIGFSSGILRPVIETAKMEPALGTIEAGMESHVVRDMSELVFSAPVKLDWIVHLLNGVVGGISSATAGGESVVYEHTITAAATPPSYTMTMLDGVNNDHATYGMVRKLTLTCPADGIMVADVEMVGQKIEAGAGTASYSTDHHMQGSFGALKMENDTTNLAGGSAINFTNFSITFERDITPVFVYGATEPNKLVAGALRITGELSILWEATTYRDLLQNGSRKAMEIKFLDSGTTIGSAENPELTITLDKTHVVSHERPEGIDEVDVETFTFEAFYDLDEGTPRMVQAFVTNEDVGTNYT